MPGVITQASEFGLGRSWVNDNFGHFNKGDTRIIVEGTFLRVSPFPSHLPVPIYPSKLSDAKIK